MTARIPVRTNRDDRYFTDTYQAMPKHGYTRMFERMLDHPNIKVLLNADYREVQEIIPHDEVVYTGPVDEFFDYRFGGLPYRSLEFKFETLEQCPSPGRPGHELPERVPYTRVTEFKYLTGQEHPRRPSSTSSRQAEGDPVLPGAAPRERRALPKVRGAGAGQRAACTSWAGSATYKYYNMDQVVAQALTLCTRIIGVQRKDLLEMQAQGQA